MFKLNYPKFWYNKNIVACLLWLPSKLYFILGVIRRYFAKPITFPATVICVGNASIGGTGKTQIVIWLIKLLKAKNINTIVITKAYKSSVKTALLVQKHHTAYDVGDESLLISKYVTVIAAAKIQDALVLVESLNPEVIIVDDGLQNPNFTKDFTILSVDGYRGFGNGWLIPAGSLRQYPSAAFDIADVVVILEDTGNIALQQTMLSCSKPIFNATSIVNIDLDKTKTYFAFCAIGNPDRFFNTLQANGLRLAGFKTFPDHHHYSDDDCKYLQNQACNLHATLITTSKDHVKIYNKLLAENLEIKLSINNQELLQDLIYEKIFKKDKTYN
ncbi:tetraacyldisaccharide 4'-kinase [Candidatus Trichorickettsia mobilis]|uniref:tetraacyldisaccharide 4'-kinase n=1 Tax=Candidatus Trichorickettsia mobilis TaxID=1346319 RepID=UPI0029307C3C|nr:tetraacyldisaccharide 4'-kinase [Candidatus Trichorickettsia mobilis]